MVTLSELEAAVAEMERTGQGPGRWESFCVMCALAHLDRGNEEAARRQVNFLGLPPEVRPPERFNAIPSAYALLSVRHLRLAIRASAKRTRSGRSTARSAVPRDIAE